METPGRRINPSNVTELCLLNSDHIFYIAQSPFFILFNVKAHNELGNVELDFSSSIFHGERDVGKIEG